MRGIIDVKRQLHGLPSLDRRLFDGTLSAVRFQQQVELKKRNRQALSQKFCISFDAHMGLRGKAQILCVIPFEIEDST